MRHLLGLLLGIEHVFLEKGVLSVHVRAVEESVTVDDLIPVVFGVVGEVVLLVLDVVLVAANVLANNSLGHG